MLVSSNTAIRFGSGPLFRNVSVKFDGSNRCDLINTNGSDKSAFTKILNGDLESTLGSVPLGPNKRIGKLRQDQFAFKKFTVLDTVIMRHKELWETKQECGHICALPEMSEEDGYEVAGLGVKYGKMDGCSTEVRAGELSLGVRVPMEQHYGPMSEVIPGWKLRVSLAQVLFVDLDILLLDELTSSPDVDTIRWLEQVLSERDNTMIIISHNRHPPSMACTHTADLDCGELRIYPGNYGEYMTTAIQAYERLLADNAKREAQITELQFFASRFSANTSESRQVTPRVRQIDKIRPEEMKASSRQNPFIRFKQDKKLFRNVLEVEGLIKGLDNGSLSKDLNPLLGVGEKLTILGTSGVSRSTLLETLTGDLQPDSGAVEWPENVCTGYHAQDHEYEFESNLTVLEWTSQWKQEDDDEQAARSILGRLLFSQDSIKKSAKVLSGGKKRRVLLDELIMQEPNILIMNEPANHLNMESIESLSVVLELHQDTLISVSHDCGSVSSLATRALEITPECAIDFSGNCGDYLHSKGIEQVTTSSPDIVRTTETDDKHKIVRCATFIRLDSISQYIEFS